MAIFHCYVSSPEGTPNDTRAMFPWCKHPPEVPGWQFPWLPPPPLAQVVPELALCQAQRCHLPVISGRLTYIIRVDSSQCWSKKFPMLYQASGSATRPQATTLQRSKLQATGEVAASDLKAGSTNAAVRPRECECDAALQHQIKKSLTTLLACRFYTQTAGQCARTVRLQIHKCTASPMQREWCRQEDEDYRLDFPKISQNAMILVLRMTPQGTLGHTDHLPHPTSPTAQSHLWFHVTMVGWLWMTEISQWCPIETRHHPWQRPSRVVKNPRNSRCARIHMRCVRHVFHVLLLEVVDCQGLSLLSIHKISWKIWWLPSDLLERNNNIDDVNKNRFSASIHYPLVN